MKLPFVSSRRAGPAVSAVLLMLFVLSCEEGPQMDINPSLDIDLEAMTKLPSGLLYTDVEPGDGDVAEAGTTAQVGYSGYFTGGDMFDSGSFSFAVGAGQVVAGFDEGIKGMKVGGRRQLVIPSHLGYGDQDMGPIPGGSTLIFVVELQAVSR